MTASDSRSSGLAPASEAAKGLVLSATRRHVSVSLDRSTIIPATVAVRGMPLVAGDIVEVRHEAGENLISSVMERRNLLARWYRNETKPVAANVNHLFVVAAVPPLLNTLSIDRMAVVAHSEGIPWTLIVNKIDLGIEACLDTIRVYEQLGVTVLKTAAKFGVGMDIVRSSIAAVDGGTVALCGVSGVGKSTLLNKLIPEAARSTAEVSARTGQGKQTTTQAIGFLYPRPGIEGLAIIDLPGIQQFGVGHLTTAQVAAAFPEIQAQATSCEFSDCAHLREQSCSVRDAAKAGGIAASRYESYCYMCKEIEDAKPY